MGIKNEIMSVLKENGAMTVAEIAEALGRKKSTWLHETLKDMALSGMLTQSKRPTRGKPAFVYEWRNPKSLTLRQQWRRYCEEHLPIDYTTWLEEELKRKQ